VIFGTLRLVWRVYPHMERRGRWHQTHKAGRITDLKAIRLGEGGVKEEERWWSVIHVKGIGKKG